MAGRAGVGARDRGVGNGTGSGSAAARRAFKPNGRRRSANQGSARPVGARRDDAGGRGKRFRVGGSPWRRRRRRWRRRCGSGRRRRRGRTRPGGRRWPPGRRCWSRWPGWRRRCGRRSGWRGAARRWAPSATCGRGCGGSSAARPRRCWSSSAAGGRSCGPCGTPWGPAWPPCCGCTRSGRRSWAWRRPCGAGRAAPRWLTRWRGCRTWSGTTGSCTWRASCCCSASAATAWQTWRPCRSLGRGFWRATRKTSFKIRFLRSLCLWTTSESCAAHQAPDGEQEGLASTAFCESLVCSEVTTKRMMN